MRGRWLGHVGGILGLAAFAAGVTLGASAEIGAAAPPRAETAVEQTGTLEAADERPSLLVPTRALPWGAPAKRPRAAAGENAHGDGEAAGRPWSVRVVGPDEEPLAGAKVSIQFKRNGNTSYPHYVGAVREVVSDREGLATVDVPERAEFAWIEAEAPEGWVAPPGRETRGCDPVRDALRRARLARIPAARRTPRIDVVDGGDEPFPAVTVHLDRVAAVSGRVDVPDGFPPQCVVVSARWISPLEGAWTACSVLCAEDGAFRLPVPASVATVDVEALVTDRAGEASAWRSVPEGPAAMLLPEGFLWMEPPDPPPPGEDGTSAVLLPPHFGARCDLAPVRLPHVATGAWGLRLRLEAAASAPLSVVDAEGHAVYASRVSVADAQGRRARAWIVGPRCGAYRLTGLAPGTYELVVSGPAGVARLPVRVPSTQRSCVRLERAEVVGRLADRRDTAGWYVEWHPDAAASPDAVVGVAEDGAFRLPVERGVRGRVVATCDLPDERAGWAEADGVSSEGGEVVLHPRAERTLDGRVLGLPPGAYWDFRVRWTWGLRARETDVERDGTFRLCGLPEGTAALELWSQNQSLLRWPALASGQRDLVLRCPSADDPPDAPGLAAETQPFVDALQAPFALR